MNVQRLIDSFGFCYGPYPLPSFEDCRRMVAEAAYFLWQKCDKPEGFHEPIWMAAERQMFGGLVDGGYRIFVCDLSSTENKGFLRFWDIMFVNPSGWSKP
jgi:hypothetical protein